VLKERVRTHRHPSLLILLMLILYCVSRLNYEQSSVRGWTTSPREQFSGRKADAKRDFRCAFGNYVQCTVPETDNTLKARTEDAVVMLPTGNRTGSVRMLSLHWEDHHQGPVQDPPHAFVSDRDPGPDGGSGWHTHHAHEHGSTN
jgi:hypothetical protein